MAVVAFLFGSMIGVLCGFVGWLFFGLGALMAVGLYLVLGLTIGMGLILFSLHPRESPCQEVEA